MGQQRIVINFISEKQFNTTATYVGHFVLYGVRMSFRNSAIVTSLQRRQLFYSVWWMFIMNFL